jgi:hypothetical protein
VNGGGVLYDDGRVICTEEELLIRWYYLWGSKHVPYDRIRCVTARPLSRWRGKWRLWGSGDLRHWYNLDRTRPGKETALELDLRGQARPTITPDDPDAVLQILAVRIGPQRIMDERPRSDPDQPSP